MKTIYTIGHSTHPLDEFLEMLNSFKIETVIDIRHYPGSRRYPQFNKDALEISLPNHGFQYLHLIGLGGRRKVQPNSDNIAWHHPSFRGYADYMETAEFSKAVKELEEIALKSRTVFLCSEAVWWRCHRSMVSDYLKFHHWNVMHIMGIGNETEHPYTQPARNFNGKLSYAFGEMLRK